MHQILQDSSDDDRETPSPDGGHSHSVTSTPEKIRARELEELRDDVIQRGQCLGTYWLRQTDRQTSQIVAWLVAMLQSDKQTDRHKLNNWPTCCYATEWRTDRQTDRQTDISQIVDGLVAMLHRWECQCWMHCVCWAERRWAGSSVWVATELPICSQGYEESEASTSTCLFVILSLSSIFRLWALSKSLMLYKIVG